MKQKGFAPILIIIALAIIGVLIFLILQNRTINPPPTPVPSTNPTNVSTEPTPSTTTTKRLGYIKSIDNSDGNYYMEVDFIESALPDTVRGGFKIKNTSNEVTPLSIDSNATVTMQTYSKVQDGNFVPNQFITLSQLIDAFNAGADIAASPYWIETENGKVVKILEQYVP